MKKHHVEVFRGADRQWYYRTMHRNGEKKQSSEGLRRKIDAVKSARNMAKDAGWEVRVIPTAKTK